MTRLAIYSDLIPILDAAIASQGGTYTLATHGDAVHWRQRVYKFRKAWGLAHAPPNKYDVLVLPRIPADSSNVLLTVRQAVGVWTPGGVPRAEPADDLTAAAFRLAARINGGPDA